MNRPIEINARKLIGDGTKNIFLTLALIRNDIGDITYLQKLFADDTTGVENAVNEKAGQKSGRAIYILRLACSHYYELLYYIGKKSKDISNNQELTCIINELDSDAVKNWNKLLTYSTEIIREDRRSFITKLCYKLRNEVTFHYYHASKYLNIGMQQAFIKDHTEDKNKNAFITEKNSVSIDRSYYIDLAIQRQVEEDMKLNKEMLFGSSEKVVNELADAYQVITRILQAYHASLLN